MKDERNCKYYRKSTEFKNYLKGRCNHKDGKTAPKPFTGKCIGAMNCECYEEKK